MTLLLVRISPDRSFAERPQAADPASPSCLHVTSLAPGRYCGAFGKNNVVARSAAERYLQGMKGLRYIYWQDGRFWLGYLEEYPDYLTQGESLQDLQEHLRDLYADLSGGHIPAVRKVAELELA